MEILACATCALVSPFSIAAAGILGGWASLFIILSPYRLAHRMPIKWGVPRFHLSDFFSLTLLLLWPLLIARHGREDHDPARIAVCFSLFAACVGFLWLRGMWILQQLRIGSFRKRTLFLAVLLPVTILFGFLIGHWMLSMLIFLQFPRIDMVIGQTAEYGVVAGIVYFGVRCGLNYVFGRPVVNKSPRRKPMKETNLETDA